MTTTNDNLVGMCRELIDAYKAGELGQTRMSEDSNPGFIIDTGGESAMNQGVIC